MEVDIDAQMDGGMHTSQKKKEDKTNENRNKNQILRWFDHVMVSSGSLL